MRIISFFLFRVLATFSVSYSYAQDSVPFRYETAFQKIQQELVLNSATGFKEAVFITENAYMHGRLNRNDFINTISSLAKLIRQWVDTNHLTGRKMPDSINYKSNLAIYTLLKEAMEIEVDGKKYKTVPYRYDLNDMFGKEDWRNMFVSKLLMQGSGNCHGLAYLYKILADEVNAFCWLGLAPNHVYIKNRSEKLGWYNTELTNGTFPIDAWIMGSGYIPLEAVQNGIYMDTLSNQQAIALCLVDLAKGYELQTKNYYDSFILKCCDLSLRYFPFNVQAMLLKAETLKRVYEKQKKEKQPDAKITFQQMEELYIRLYDLGYREMPEKMYLQWLQSVQKEKYQNKQVKTIVK